MPFTVTASLQEQVDVLSAENADLKAALERTNAEIRRLNGLINTPETEDFLGAIPLEAAHQIERWGADHDAHKTPWDWFWTCGYLVQKAAAAAPAGDLEKAKHHTISTAALMLNWHKRLSGWTGEAAR
ncbi:MAG: hypothetical protein Rhirs2KO_09700 [Rhizobiaceae bacterium]